jgi:hypothetical protein
MVEAAKRIKETPIPLEQLTSQRNSRWGADKTGFFREINQKIINNQ